MTVDINDVQARFERKYVVAPSGCWIWLASLYPTGYGVFAAVTGRSGYAHRVAHELFVGPIPEGLDIDHLCRVRRCVNPMHLQAVTRQVNLLRGLTLAAVHGRKTHCKRGHPFDVVNNSPRGPGGRWRECRECRRVRQRAHPRRRRAA